jgi:2-polyprenyl-6-methoxyphenol hydroxylase-like FAD-dependent oxidoreductase
MDRHPDVLVVGAGPVGMVTALSLAHRRRKVTLIDAGWRPASHTYGVALHPESLDLLDALGVLQPLLPRGQRVDGLLLYESGEQRGWMALDRLPAAHAYALAVPQAALEEELVAALDRAGVKVLWNHRAAAIDGDLAPLVRVERLAKESAGYGHAASVWVVDNVIELRPRFVVGTDGHDSFVRKSLGIDFTTLGRRHRYLALELTQPEGGAGNDLRVQLGADSVDAVWPLAGGGYRCTLEIDLPDEAVESPRVKERARWVPTGAPREDIVALAAERLPWLSLGRCAVGWSGVADFEQRLAQRYGDGVVWLAGDAAHVALPLGVQSLNVGLREAATLAGALDLVLAGAADRDALADYEATFRAEWQTLLGRTPLAAADPWLRANGGRLLPALPASGRVLSQLLERLGAAAPEPDTAPTAGALAR